MSKTHLGLWEEFKNRRLEMNLEQKDLAQMMDVSATTICNWENGIYKISQKHINKLVDLMEIEVPQERIKTKNEELLGVKRKISRDDIETILWLNKKGFNAKAIAKELNRDIDDIEEVLALRKAESPAL